MLESKQKQGRVKYFAYGSNLHLDWIKKRCPSSDFEAVALLQGYELQFRYPSTSWPGGGAADIVPKRKAETWGVLYSMSAKDMLKLDKFEDLHKSGYRRIEVLLDTVAKKEKAIAYEVVNKLEREMAPVKGYADLMLGGATSHGLPKHYFKYLKSKIAHLQRKTERQLV